VLACRLKRQAISRVLGRRLPTGKSPLATPILIGVASCSLMETCGFLESQIFIVEIIVNLNEKSRVCAVRLGFLFLFTTKINSPEF
jgi:hypothetical protein